MNTSQFYAGVTSYQCRRPDAVCIIYVSEKSLNQMAQKQDINIMIKFNYVLDRVYTARF